MAGWVLCFGTRKYTIAEENVVKRANRKEGKVFFYICTKQMYVFPFFGK